MFALSNAGYIRELIQGGQEYLAFPFCKSSLARLKQGLIDVLGVPSYKHHPTATQDCSNLAK
jgi:hypothetical protein